MSTHEMPSDGGGEQKGKPDGVSGGPQGGNVHGRTEGGESGGGGYANPNTGKTPANSGFMGHGGQTEMDYHGGDQGSRNAATGGGGADDADAGPAPPPAPDRESRRVAGDTGSFEVIETSGVAQAEATGTIGTDADHEGGRKDPAVG